jgi:uncharacterized repeat protein (TIGR03803 family)
MRLKDISIARIAARIVLTTVLFVGVPRAFAQEEKVLDSFNPKAKGPGQSFAGLISDAAGHLYGTTEFGGGGPCDNSLGCGTVFELSPTSGGGWTQKVLYNFCPQSNCPDGAYPLAGLVFDAAGNLYGTTYRGGAHFWGTVFELTPAAGGWKERVLHNFNKNGTDGYGPEASLIFDTQGNLYGTTSSGGAYGAEFSGGTVFELQPAVGGRWSETVLHSFGHGTDGSEPESALIFDAAGNLYGTTPLGGPYNGGFAGTVFELTPTAGGTWTETILYNFGNGTDPDGPQGLVFDADGNLYTMAGDGVYGKGTVVELKPASGGGWTATIIYSFNGTDGYAPNGGLIMDKAGNLYGTTDSGGAFDNGAAFELSPTTGGDWTETVLHNFGRNQDGRNPHAPLLLNSSGNLYGTTIGGGANSEGTVFEIKP